MSITNGPNLGLMVNGNQGEGHYSQFMAFLRGVDGLVMPNVKGYLVNTPPASPASGDCYIIGAAPTGAWAGKGSYVTRWSTTANTWEFYLPKNGWMLQANSARESYRRTGGGWEVFYQEGTWTPTMPSGWTNTGTPSANGWFRKIGNYCVAIADIAGASAGGTGTVSFANGAILGGLPFTTATLAFYAGYPGAFCVNTNGGARVADAFTSGVSVYLTGSGPANAYSYCTKIDFFI